jgi:hypothetical protein
MKRGSRKATPAKDEISRLLRMDNTNNLDVLVPIKDQIPISVQVRTYTTANEAAILVCRAQALE